MQIYMPTYIQFKGFDVLGITEVNGWRCGGVTVFYGVNYRLH